MRLRSILRAPASGLAFEAALRSPADAVVLALNDASIAIAEARAAAAAAIPRIAAAGKLALVVVNHPRTRLLRDDVAAIVSPALAAVLLPHTNEPQDVRDLAVALREFEHARGIEPGTVRAFPVVDGARGLLRAAEIVTAVPRAAGLVFDSGQYALDVGARDEEGGGRLAYARGAVVAAARADAGLPLIVCSAHAFRKAAQTGFAGALLVSATEVSAAHAAFTPGEAARSRAGDYVGAYEEARNLGEWVARRGCEIVDAHAMRQARRLLDQAD